MEHAGRFADWLELLRPYRWPVLSGLACLLVDLLTKDLASMLLAGRPPVELGVGIRLVHRTNPGLLLGLFSDLSPGLRQFVSVGLAGLALLFIPGLVGWLVRHQTLRAWAVALISAGALGNFLERLWRAEVVDFLQIGPATWRLPAFNLADLAILAGTTLVLLALTQAGFSREKQSPDPTEG